MIAVILTAGGTYNIIGTRNDNFVLEGNLTLTEMEELAAKILTEIKVVRAVTGLPAKIGEAQPLS